MNPKELHEINANATPGERCIEPPPYNEDEWWMRGRRVGPFVQLVIKDPTKNQEADALHCKVHNPGLTDAMLTACEVLAALPCPDGTLCCPECCTLHISLIALHENGLEI